LREDEIATVLQSIDDNKYNILANHIDTLFNNYKDYLIRKEEDYKNYKKYIQQWRIARYESHFKKLWEYFYPKYKKSPISKEGRDLLYDWTDFINYVFPKSLLKSSAAASSDVISKDFTMVQLENAFAHFRDDAALIAETIDDD
jgi:hypothetical protein